MIRTYYRLVLTVLCALAAYITPVPTLKYPYDLGYFAGGLAAALLTWALLVAVIALEPEVHPGLQFILGAGAGVITWAQTTVVSIFEVIPYYIEFGALKDTFDPIWLLSGASPLAVLVIALWVCRTVAKPFWEALFSALFRFSIPLALLQLIPKWLGLPKQFRWLFLFTGVMFLLLDGLGTGRTWPLAGAADEERG